MRKDSVRNLPPPIGSLDDLADDDPRIHDMRWLGDDGANVFLEWQGSLVCVAYRRGPKICPTRHKRGRCMPFSRGSRLRMFKLINRLDWSRAGRSSFLTTTFPDQEGVPHYADITYARSRFKRGLERAAEKKLAGMWRVEWQCRKSGDYVGKPMPHVHALYFDTPWIPREIVQGIWSQALGRKDYVNVDIREVRDLRLAMHYIAKYIGKAPDPAAIGYLGIGSYLNSGRAWGCYRKELLPLGDGGMVRVPPGELTAEIRAIARAAWKGCPDSERQGFSLFGPATAKIVEAVEKYVAKHVAAS